MYKNNIKISPTSFIFIILVLTSYSVCSQTDITNIGARSAAMANASLTLNDVWAVQNNPAGYARLSNYNVGLYYENKFLMKETNFAALVASMPLMSGNLAFACHHYGYSAFQNNKISLGYSQQLFRNFSLGVNLNYFSIRQLDHYGNLNAISFDIGMIASPKENLNIALLASNPINISYFEDKNIKPPLILRLGMSYLFSKSLLLAIETGKSLNAYTNIFRIGAEYNINTNFALRAGVAFNPNEYSFGFGYNTLIAQTNKLFIDATMNYNFILGINPKLSIHYEF